MRTVDVAGLIPPSWQSVQQHEYEPWQTERLVLDTVHLSPDQALETIERYLATGAP